MITSTSEGHFVHWKGMKLSDLLEAEDRLVAHLKPLPFQEGRPLATMAEESTELVDARSDDLISSQALIAEEGEDDGDLPIIDFDAVSEDEATANTGDENTPIVRHGGPGTELTQPAEGGSMSACDLCIASLMPNSLP
jgi:hypothetical protein